MPKPTRRASDAAAGPGATPDPTNGFRASPFRPHGRIVAHPQGRVVYFESAGPFNYEAVEVMVRAYTPLMAEMANGGVFAHISIFHESMLATPDAFVAFGELLREWRESGLMPKLNAYVVAPDVEGKALMLPRYAAAFEGQGVFRAFETLAEAEAWVAEEMP